MQQQGHIRLLRSFKDWRYYSDPSTCRLYEHLLISANFAPTDYLGITVGRGQYYASLSEISGETGLSKQQIRTALRKLIATGEVNTKQAQGKNLITICNYDSYLEEQHASNTELTHLQHDANTMLTRGKEEKKEEIPPIPPKEVIKEESAKNDKNDKNENNNKLKSEDFSMSVSQAKSDAANITIPALVDFFNSELGICKSSLKPVRRGKGIDYGSKRYINLVARVNAYGVDAVKEVFAKAAQSDFLNGKNTRNWMATFDWLLKPTNFQKVLDGNYDNNPGHSIEQPLSLEKAMEIGRRVPLRNGSEFGREEDFWNI